MHSRHSHIHVQHAATAHPCTRGIRTSMCSTCVSRTSVCPCNQTMDWPPRCDLSGSASEAARARRSGSQRIYGWRFGGKSVWQRRVQGQFDPRQHERLAVIIVVWNSKRSLRVAECIRGNSKRCSPCDADSAPLSRPPRQHRRSGRSRSVEHFAIALLTSRGPRWHAGKPLRAHRRLRDHRRPSHRRTGRQERVDRLPLPSVV